MESEKRKAEEVVDKWKGINKQIKKKKRNETELRVLYKCRWYIIKEIRMSGLFKKGETRYHVYSGNEINTKYRIR